LEWILEATENLFYTFFSPLSHTFLFPEVAASIPYRACPLDLFNFLRLLCFLQFHNFFGLFFKFLLLFLLFFKNSLFCVSLLLLSCLIILKCLLSFKSILSELLLICIDALELSTEFTNYSKDLLLDLSGQALSSPVGEVAWDLRYHTHIDIIIRIILVEFFNNEPAHTLVFFLPSLVYRVKIDLKFELKQEDLLLFADGNGCTYLDRLDLIESD